MSEICFDCLNEIFGGNEDVKDLEKEQVERKQKRKTNQNGD